MSDDKTGGPAFPSEHPMFRTLPNRDKGSTDMELIGGDGQRVGTCAVFMEGRMVPHTGMTLRDYFAAKAMQAMVGNHRVINHPNPQIDGDVTTTEPHREMILDYNILSGEHEGTAEIAADAYAIADAMLAARKEDK